MECKAIQFRTCSQFQGDKGNSFGRPVASKESGQAMALVATAGFYFEDSFDIFRSESTSLKPTNLYEPKDWQMQLRPNDRKDSNR